MDERSFNSFTCRACLSTIEIVNRRSSVNKLKNNKFQVSGTTKELGGYVWKLESTYYENQNQTSNQTGFFMVTGLFISPANLIV